MVILKKAATNYNGHPKNKIAYGNNVSNYYYNLNSTLKNTTT